MKLLEEAAAACEGGDAVQQLVRRQFGDSKLTCLHLAAEGGHR